jgi:hypothetical protein
MHVASYHHEQAFPHSCLAACATMVRLRTGILAPDAASDHERELMHRLDAGHGGLLIDVVAQELASRCYPVDPDLPNNVLRLQAELQTGRLWHIAIVGSLEIGARHRELGLDSCARHGPISPPLGPPHAILLTGSTADVLEFLDPWLPQNYQPLTISTERFACTWTGMFIPILLP